MHYQIINKFHILCFLLVFIFSGAQDLGKNTESLKLKLEQSKSGKEQVDQLNKISGNLRYNQIEKGLEYGQKALDLANQISYKDGVAEALYNIGVLYYYKGDYKSALEYYIRSKKHYELLKNSNRISDIESLTGSVYFSLGQYKKALENYNSALKKYEASGNLIGTAQVKDNIGTLHYYLNDKKRSLKYNLEAITLFQEAGYTENTFYSTSLINLGLNYFENDDLKNAEKYYKLSMLINKKIGNQYLLAKNYCSLGDIYFKKNQTEKSEIYHLSALELGKKIGNQEVIAYSSGDLGRTYLLKSQQESIQQEKNVLEKKAIEFLEKSVTVFKKTKNIQAYQEYAKDLSEAYTEQGLYKKALDAFKEHSFYKDSLFNQEKLKEFTRKEMGFEFAKREDSLNMLNDKKIAVKDATLKENKKKIWFYIFGIFLLLIIGGMLIFQNRNQKKNNQKLSKLNEDLQAANIIKNKFFNILNHDLRVPISNVIKLLKLSQNKEFELDEQTKLRLETQTVDVAENLLVTMEDLLLWSKGQMQNFKLDFGKVMLQRLFNELMQHYEIGDRNIITVDIPEDIYLITDENYFKTIIRNLTSNAIKATSNVKHPKIRWTAFHRETSIMLKILDNGKGGDISDFNALFSDEKDISVKSGLGLRLVREMAISVNCKITVDTIPERGTEIELEFQI